MPRLLREWGGGRGKPPTQGCWHASDTCYQEVSSGRQEALWESQIPRGRGSLSWAQELFLLHLGVSSSPKRVEKWVEEPL